MFSRRIKIASASILLVLFHLEYSFGTPLQKDVLSVLRNSESDKNVQQSKQFIGTSVIGGLMWPVLLTLTVTAIMSRFPDAIQRLFTRPAGLGRKKRSENNEYLDSIMKSFLTAMDAMERTNSESNLKAK